MSTRLLPVTVMYLLAIRPGMASDVDYQRDIKPLLREKCYACHGALKQESDLRVDTVASLIAGGAGGTTIVTGKPADSLLIDVLTGDAGFRMPPEDEGAPLTAEQIELVKQWIRQGAPAPENEEPQPDPRSWWSYQPVTTPPVPQPQDATWADSPIDAFIAVAREQRQLTPRPEASSAVWLRRVYLDLIGLPPTRQELLEFIDGDSPQMRAQVVDSLLARPEYGERWGRHWMDIWRYSDWYGRRASNEIRYSQRHIWRWRDWIIESLNADSGYDRMLREMLAADELAGDDPSVLPATGYLGRNWYKFDRNVWLFDTVEKTSEALLGLKMRCARCHDHKFDPVTQEEYYRFRAFFEPHDVRIDPVSAFVDTEVDNGRDQVPSDGIPRVFDSNADAKTFLFHRGDSRYPDESTELTPAVPAVFGAGDLPIKPVTLPAGAWYPALRPGVRDTFVERAERHVAKLADQLLSAREAAAAAARKVDAARSAAGTPDTSTNSAVFLADDFSIPRPDVWTTVNGDWVYEDGKLIEKAVTSFATLVTRQNHPENFEMQLRYRPLQPGTYRSVGFSFDYQDKGNSQDVYTSTGDARQSVQAFHRTKGRQVYPQAGIVQTTLQIGEIAELVVTVRGTQLKIRLNGEQKLDYVLPIGRQPGKFALWVHAGSAEFHSLQIRELRESLEDLERRQRDAEFAVALAESDLKIGQAERDAVRARLAADIARHWHEKNSNLEQYDPEQAAMAASKAERIVDRLKAQQQVDRLSHQLSELEITGADSAARQKAAQDLEAARKALNDARAAVNGADGTYTPIGTVYPKTSTGRRTALARWITSPSNPRTSRVAANHLWNRHFGRPLVDTTENFGLNGRLPTHPELLDWLATELIRQDWKMKPLHRQIVLSRTYALASTPGDDSHNRAADPENRYYWRAHSRRMEAEVVRDSVLYLAGQLDLTRGGPDLAPDQGDQVLRRSLYFRNTPNSRMTFLETFDLADPNACYRRRESVVPQQALALMNSQLTASRVPAITGQIHQTRPPTASDTDFVRAAFETILNRPPTRQEAERCLEFLTEATEAAGNSASADAQHQLVHILLLHNDFVTIR